MQISRMPGSVLHSVLGCLLVYCWAALGCSFLWVLLASLGLAAVEQRRQRRREEREAARRLLGAGEEVWLGAGTRLPAWATFPDIESVSWLNTLAAEVSSEAALSIYTVSTQYLHNIYTVSTLSTQYLLQVWPHLAAPATSLAQELEPGLATMLADYHLSGFRSGHYVQFCRLALKSPH